MVSMWLITICKALGWAVARNEALIINNRVLWTGDRGGSKLSGWKLMGKGYYRPNIYIMETSTELPDSKHLFKGVEVPFYKEAVDIALQVHRFYFGRIVLGLDFAITEKGSVIIEVNCQPVLPTIQLYHANPKMQLFG